MLSHALDANGRRLLVPLAHEQEVLRKIESMRADGLKLREIARRLNEAKIPARRDGRWRPQRISIVLQRSGKHTVRPTKRPGPRIPLRYDPEAATARANELRAQGLSLREVGLRLRKERLTPQRGGIWHPAQAAELLREAQRGDREAAARRTEGFLPKEGDIWHPGRCRRSTTTSCAASTSLRSSPPASPRSRTTLWNRRWAASMSPPRRHRRRSPSLSPPNSTELARQLFTHNWLCDSRRSRPAYRDSRSVLHAESIVVGT